MSAWLLPDHIADALPLEAAHIEALRRRLLDTARSFGYELVMPPLLEHLQSLLTGSGQSLQLQTFKLVDQLSGQTLGLRPDMTQQVARIDAHLLNRTGVARLCYAGSIAHTHPERPQALREALQFGAEIYGHAGLEADVEALELAITCLRRTGLAAFTVDMADVRIVQALLAAVPALEAATVADIHAALAAKDSARLAEITQGFPPAARQGLLELVQLYGDVSVLDEAERALATTPTVRPVLQHLRTYAQALSHVSGAGVELGFDLADLRGHSYYSGTRFALYARGVSDAIVRGGRYDEVGAAYGRRRPAAGFSLDVRTLAALVPCAPASDTAGAIRAPWAAGDAQLTRTIAELRQAGHTVICTLPGQHHNAADDDAAHTLHCDRALVQESGTWVVRAL